MTVRTHTLPNGLRIVTEQMPGLQSASVGIWVTAGCRHEAEAENGIAHFLEHMAFKGTQSRSPLEIAEAIEDVGGYINAYTSREMTAYYARVLGSDVPLAIDVISDILTKPLFDPAEIEIERGVILQEIGQALDTPDDIIFDWLQEVSFPGQAMGRPILGPPERVSAFSRDDLRRFVKANYGPERMILAAAGDVEHDAIVAQAQELLGGLTAQGATPATPALYAGGERRVVKELEQAHYALSLEGPGYLADDIYTAQIHAGILGGGMSSRLFQEAREKRGLCYSIFAQSAAYADTGALMIYAGTAEDRLVDLTTVITDELRRFPETVTSQELERARAQMKAGLLMGLEGASGRCERLARMTAIWTRDDLIRFGAAQCAEARPAQALYGPVAGAPDHEAIRAQLAA